ncbi:hypothetical protein GCM10011326_30470 [Salipiger profundus]|nr:hypothetical protein GCM10011326_30470 [Salipiger profundus]
MPLMLKVAIFIWALRQAGPAIAQAPPGGKGALWIRRRFGLSIGGLAGDQWAQKNYPQKFLFCELFSLGSEFQFLVSLSACG